MTQHTPGPWDVVPYESDSAWECIEARGAHLACVSKSENVANARLIAAAPMLLEALEGTAHKLEIIYKANKDQLSLGDIEILMEARAAIRAAKGESNG